MKYNHPKTRCKTTNIVYARKRNRQVVLKGYLKLAKGRRWELGQRQARRGWKPQVGGRRFLNLSGIGNTCTHVFIRLPISETPQFLQASPCITRGCGTNHRTFHRPGKMPGQTATSPCLYKISFYLLRRHFLHYLWIS